MTDQTTHDVTDDERMLARKWAKSIESRTETWTACTRAAVRVILDAVPTPPSPTLADMTMPERLACQWMQADVKGGERSVVIVNPNWRDGSARVMCPSTRMREVLWESVTPRPDLPRMEWPSGQKAALEETPESEEEFMANIEKALDDHYGPLPAPALPDGWRLANHPHLGRVVVTRTEPDDDGEAAIIVSAPTNVDRARLEWCRPDELTYIDQGAADAVD